MGAGLDNALLNKLHMEKQNFNFLNAQAEREYTQERHYRMMVIDDDNDINRLLRHDLVNYFPGSSCIAYSSEFEALHYISRQAVDVIMIDINLDSMNGLKLGEVIQSMVKYKVPIIYISAYDRSEYGKMVKHQYNAHFLPKPLNLEDLHLLIEALV